MSKRARCIIVDDEPLAIRLLKAHLEGIPQIELVKTFENPVEALSFLREDSVDLAFLDIQMPMLTGIDFARSLKSPPAIIFTTAYRDYAVESYELEVVDYLVKPITFPRFCQAADKFLERHISRAENTTPIELDDSSQPTHRYFNVNKKHVKVQLKEITHIESLKDYIQIYTTSQRLVTKEKISDFSKSLPINFLRVHRSYIVNVQHVTAYTAHDIEIGAEEIPIGVSYKLEVMKRLKS